MDQIVNPLMTMTIDELLTKRAEIDSAIAQHADQMRAEIRRIEAASGRLSAPRARVFGRCGRPHKYPWMTMNVGDEFLHDGSVNTSSAYAEAKRMTARTDRTFRAEMRHGLIYIIREA